MSSFEFQSRRSPVYATNGMVSSSQPLATQAGLRILQQGGNAADAAVAVAAALNVTQPNSTGIGGDMFALFWNNKTKTVHGINGSGRCPSGLSIEKLSAMGFNQQNRPDVYSPLWITVPGAAAGWIDTVEKFGAGKLSLRQILEPAIQMAENGFPVAPVSAKAWSSGLSQLRNGPNGDEMLLNGRPPREGDILRLPTLAQTFRDLADKGKAGFYEGRVAQAIVEVVTQLGGVMSLEDLKSHVSTFEEPIHVNYRGVDVYEIPPNGQGITALMALQFLTGFDISKMKYHSQEHLHVLIESLRFAFADTRYYVSDPKFTDVPVEKMLSNDYADVRRSLFDPNKAVPISNGHPANVANTVYFSVVDGEGNACSFINSNYMGFGTGIIPKGCGFTLHNRGMAVKEGELYCAFGVMGGFMQPQGHVQVLSNMIDFGMNPQQALDSPRFQIDGGDANAGAVLLEEGIDESVVDALRKMGHKQPRLIKGWNARTCFGIGQIILRNPTSGVLCAGSDPRHDGCSAGY